MLRQRLMWPKKGEKVQVFKHGQLIADGIVLSDDPKKVSIMGSQMIFLDGAELSAGIDNGSYTVKKSH
jgi:hypothetical protein